MEDDHQHSDPSIRHLVPRLYQQGALPNVVYHQPIAMVHLTQLPPEILHNILSHVDPEDTGFIRQTCRYLLTFIDGNRALFRELYYRTLVSLPSQPQPVPGINLHFRPDQMTHT